MFRKWTGGGGDEQPWPDSAAAARRLLWPEQGRSSLSLGDLPRSPHFLLPCLVPLTLFCCLLLLNQNTCRILICWFYLFIVFLGFRAIGCGVALSTLSAVLINGFLGPKTRPVRSGCSCYSPFFSLLFLVMVSFGNPGCRIFQVLGCPFDELSFDYNSNFT